MLSEKVNNREISIKEYESGKLNINSYPRIIFTELTQNCNLNCEMCHGTSYNQAPRNMEFSTFLRISELFFNKAEIIDLRGWGESVIIPNFSDFLNETLKYNCQLRIVTNLSYHAHYALKLLAKSNSILSISIDATKQSFLDKLRKGAKFDLIDRNLELLKHYYKLYNHDFSNVYFGVTVQLGNIEEILNIVKYAHNYGIKKIALYPRQNNGDFFPELSIQQMNKLNFEIVKAFKIASKNNIELRIVSKLHKNMGYIDIKTYKYKCIKPWQYCFIDYKGNVGFCDFIIGDGWEKNSIGNIHDNDILDKWKSGEKMNEIRKAHVIGKADCKVFSDNCSWCYKNRFVDFEDALLEKHKTQVFNSIENFLHE